MLIIKKSFDVIKRNHKLIIIKKYIRKLFTILINPSIGSSLVAHDFHRDVLVVERTLPVNPVLFYHLFVSADDVTI